MRRKLNHLFGFAYSASFVVGLFSLAGNSLLALERLKNGGLRTTMGL